jgi:hypothetical protein
MKKKSVSTATQLTERTFDARPDTLDFRDKMYVPTLVEVPLRIPLQTYLGCYRPGKVPILDQGKEGACTGFGLAAVAHFLLRRRKVVPDSTPISPRMFYEMARRYDEWAGEAYSGSSARGAMKGWHKHGVCAQAVWPSRVDDHDNRLTDERAVDAGRRPLGAYFRVNHLDLVAMHSAISEVGVLYVTANVHAGWGQIDVQGVIPFTNEPLGAHAFAMVGYDERGFWIQNSWGDTWGCGGFALVTYDDWLANGTDVWVARLGAPVLHEADRAKRRAVVSVSGQSEYVFSELRPHLISLGNDGQLRPGGTFGTTAADVRTIFTEDFPRVTKGWPKKRLLLYAHGGLVSEADAIQRVADYRKPLLEAQVYPLAFIWKTDFWTTLTNVLQDLLRRRRPEGFLDAAKDFMLDRLDDTLEVLARPLAGKAEWREMKENALLATTSQTGGARLALEHIAQLATRDPSLEIHVAGHSAGSIFMAPVVQKLATRGAIKTGSLKGEQGQGLNVATLTLWAPACTMQLFKDAYLPVLRAGGVRSFALFTLKDAAEQDDHCAHIYHKSLLYLVSNAFEEKSGLLWAKGTPLLGLENSILSDADFQVRTNDIRSDDPDTVPILGLPSATWIRSPNTAPDGSPNHSESRRHGDFDDDAATLRATLAHILGVSSVQAPFEFKALAAARRATRTRLAGRSGV